jgi:glycosyltransferase involved in cell wall biosynthesis
MKVLLTTVGLARRGGVAAFYRSLRKEFSPAVEYFVVGARSDHEIPPVYLVRGIADAIRFYRTLARGGYHLVHLNPSLDFKAVIRDGMNLLIARRFPVKIVVFIHGWKEPFYRVLSSWWSAAFRAVFSRADVMLVLASEFKEHLRSLGFTNPIFVETTVVDSGFLAACPAEALERKQFRSVGEGLRILCLSRVEKAKGIYEALGVYELLRAKYPALSLTVAGEGSELLAARTYVTSRRLEGVEFTGYVQGADKERLFMESDIYLFPSHTEGMPQSLLEAMSFGLPVVTRAVGGVPNFFQDGTMGHITDSLDPAVLASLVERLIVAPGLRRSMGQFNHAFARERFTAEGMARRLEALYASMLVPGEGAGKSH